MDPEAEADGERRFNKGNAPTVFKATGTKKATWQAKFADGYLPIQYVDVSLVMRWYKYYNTEDREADW